MCVHVYVYFLEIKYTSFKLKHPYSKERLVCISSTAEYTNNKDHKQDLSTTCII